MSICLHRNVYMYICAFYQQIVEFHQKCINALGNKKRVLKALKRETQITVSTSFGRKLGDFGKIW